MAKERALTLEALRYGCDRSSGQLRRRMSWDACLPHLATPCKTEEELFDRSGHRTKFKFVGSGMLLERGAFCWKPDKLTTDAEARARLGNASHHCDRSVGTDTCLFPLIDKLAAKANTQLAIITEVLAGAWERLEQGRRILLSRRICIFVPRRRSTRASSIR